MLNMFNSSDIFNRHSIRVVLKIHGHVFSEQIPADINRLVYFLNRYPQTLIGSCILRL